MAKAKGILEELAGILNSKKSKTGTEKKKPAKKPKRSFKKPKSALKKTEKKNAKKMPEKAAAPKKIGIRELMLMKTDEKIARQKSGSGVDDAHTVSQARELSRKLGSSIGHLKARKPASFIATGIPGFDDMFEAGIPKGSSLLVAGGAGTGKTIFSLQTLAYGCRNGEKCIYLSFEENADRLVQHMRDFGWDPDKWIKEGKLVIKRLDPFDISRSVEALLTQAKGELLIEFESIPGMIPKGFKPDRIVLDSLTAMASAFSGKEDSYRIYIEQFFRLLEKVGANSFLITETEQVPNIFSKTGDEEFLADGVIVLYNIRKDNVRVSAIEVLKLRGAKHEKKLIPFRIVSGKGIVAYPEEEIYTSIE